MPDEVGPHRGLPTATLWVVAGAGVALALLVSRFGPVAVLGESAPIPATVFNPLALILLPAQVGLLAVSSVLMWLASRVRVGVTRTVLVLGIVVAAIGAITVMTDSTIIWVPSAVLMYFMPLIATAVFAVTTVKASLSRTLAVAAAAFAFGAVCYAAAVMLVGTES